MNEKEERDDHPSPLTFSTVQVLSERSVISCRSIDGRAHVDALELEDGFSMAAALAAHLGATPFFPELCNRVV